jgi:hypothetical protein
MKRPSVNGCENIAVLMLLEETSPLSILRLLKSSHFLFVNYLLGKSGKLYAPCKYFAHMCVGCIFSYSFFFHLRLNILLTFISFFSSSPSQPCHYFLLYPHFQFVILIYYFIFILILSSSPSLPIYFVHLPPLSRLRYSDMWCHILW